MTTKTRRYWTPSRMIQFARERLTERLEHAQERVALSTRSDDYYRGQVDTLRAALSLLDGQKYRDAEVKAAEVCQCQ